MTFVEQSNIIKKIKFRRIALRNYSIQVIFFIILAVSTSQFSGKYSSKELVFYFSFFWISIISILVIFVKSFRVRNLKSIGPRGKKVFLGSFATYLVLFVIYGYSYNYVRFKTWKPRSGIYEIKNSKEIYKPAWRKIIDGNLVLILKLKPKEIEGEWQCRTRVASIALEKLKEYMWNDEINFELVDANIIQFDHLKFKFLRKEYPCNPYYRRNYEWVFRKLKSIRK